mmetsp:Transcript_166972/g.536062  ORF Transcript_166972/g.536062 Transcript_166972/m.536062 type:complete len:212 (+) Transcript_166972:1525-2160(+)
MVRARARKEVVREVARLGYSGPSRLEHHLPNLPGARLARLPRMHLVSSARGDAGELQPCAGKEPQSRRKLDLAGCIACRLDEFSAGIADGRLPIRLLLHRFPRARRRHPQLVGGPESVYASAGRACAQGRGAAVGGARPAERPGIRLGRRRRHASDLAELALPSPVGAGARSVRGRDGPTEGLASSVACQGRLKMEGMVGQSCLPPPPEGT